MNSLLPEGFEMPSSPYMDLLPGDNRFRILESTAGYEGWRINPEDQSKKQPVRRRKQTDFKPGEVLIDEKNKIKMFLALKVWNYASKSVQLLQINQLKSIIRPIINHSTLQNEEGEVVWGHPRNYDITIKKEGTGLNTKYEVVFWPTKEISEEMKHAESTTHIDLDKLFTGQNPFDTEPIHQTAAEVANTMNQAPQSNVPEYPTDDINPEDIPF